jgi:hypothetical protein
MFSTPVRCSEFHNDFIIILFGVLLSDRVSVWHKYYYHLEYFHDLFSPVECKRIALFIKYISWYFHYVHVGKILWIVFADKIGTAGLWTLVYVHIFCRTKRLEYWRTYIYSSYIHTYIRMYRYVNIKQQLFVFFQKIFFDLMF